MTNEKKTLGLEDPDVVVKNTDENSKDENVKKKKKTLSLDEQGINYWGDFINPWTRGYKCYKPWIK